ncbi:MAG TPA: hypothetical protein VJ741_16320 [Solirubrobacteraceae bacterium]|nr:hypothetical protein [Solirubrobacteraceae bacterium]
MAHFAGMAASVRVIGVGAEIDRLFSGQPAALPIPGPPGQDDLRDLYDALAGPLRGGEAVIVILGDWLPEDALRGVRTVHSLLQTDRVAVHVTSLPPLATSVLAALAAALAPAAPSAGALAGALEIVADELYVLAWTGSVAGLQHPSVSLLHHARSLLPGSAFGVGLQPEVFVQSVSREPTVPLEPCEHQLQLLVAPTDSSELSWVLDVVAPALGGVPVRELAPTMHGPGWWGSSRLVEVVGVPSSLEWLAEVAFSDAPVPCSWCGEPILAAPCPFCGEAAAPGATRSPHDRPGVLASGAREGEAGGQA